jgi:hypothetical protein
MVWEEMKATRQEVGDFPDQWTDLLVALNQLRLATDTAAEARTEYLRKAAVKETEIANPIAAAVIEFRRTWAIREAENEEYVRKMSRKNQSGRNLEHQG